MTSKEPATTNTDGRQRLHLSLAMGNDLVKREKDLPRVNAKERAMTREARAKGSNNHPGRS